MKESVKGDAPAMPVTTGGAMPPSGFAGGRGTSKDGRGDEMEAKKSQDKATQELDKAIDEAVPLGEGRGKIDDFYENDRKKLAARAFYRKVDPTTEWAENNYYKLLISQQPSTCWQSPPSSIPARGSTSRRTARTTMC